MTINITDVDTFTATIVAPADGEAITSASDVQPLQGLANRTKNLNTRLTADELKTPIGAKYTITATDPDGSFGNGPFNLTAVTVNAGYTLVGGNTIQVPTAGRYLINAMVKRESTSVTNPLQFGAFVIVDTGTGASKKVENYTYRWSATTGLKISSPINGIVLVTDPATDLISVTIIGGGGISDDSEISITRIA